MALPRIPVNGPPATAPDRRTALRGFAAVGLVGAGGLLAACGGDDEAATGGGTGTAAQTGEGSPEPSASESTAAEPLAKTADVPVGGGVVVGDVVVTQPTAGEFKAFSSKCTHQGCTVGSVADGKITCFCHGSVYSAADGSVLNPPAPAPLPEVAVTVSGEDVVRG